MQIFNQRYTQSPFTTLLIILAITFSSPVLAETGNRFFTITFENDIFVGEDNGYTNGSGFTFGHAGFSDFNHNNTPRWILKLTKRLPIATRPDRLRGISHMFFQRMQTPNDITDPNYNPDEVPYAGLLAWQGTMYSSTDRVSDQLSLYLGLIGPSAGGEAAQKAVHAAIGSDEPLGWQFQIRDTPIFKLEYQKVWSLYKRSNSPIELEVVGLGGAGIGNLKTATKWGLALRVGKNLKQSLSAFSLQADRQVNPLAFSKTNDWYGFVGARAGYVAYDIWVDGRIPEGLEQNITNESIRNDLAAGFVWSLGRFAFVFEVASMSSPIEQFKDREQFGAVSVTLKL